MKLIVVRHGEKDTTREDGGLTKRGLKQVKYLVKRLKKEKFNEIYCSNLNRSKQTAEPIAKALRLPLKVMPFLNEFKVDIFRQRYSKLNKKTKEQLNSLKSFLNSITKIASNREKILIVAHGNTNRIIISHLLEMPLKNFVRFRQLETAINEIYWVEHFKNWRLNSWNDVSHQKKKLIEGEGKY